MMNTTILIKLSGQCQNKWLVMTFFDSLAFLLVCFFLTINSWCFDTSDSPCSVAVYYDYLFIYLLYISYNILTSWHATATNEEAGKNALTTLLFSKTAILWQLVKLLIASRVLSSHQAVLSCLSCAGLVNRDGAVAIPDAVTGGEGAVFLWDKRSCRLLYQVIGLTEVLHWAFSCQALRVEVGAQLLFRDTPCEQHGLWRLQRDVEADPYSLSIPHYQLGCFFSLASYTISLWGNVGQH